ncbi:MAG TPA: PD-(D/E)XK nuclease family protein, partial [Longimicrobiales bacterium]|nr:PD-(D/E)XK nuclease family protein [Longimicrobiales bacterium]
VDRILERSFYLPFAGPIPAERLRDAARRRVASYVSGWGVELGRTVKPEYRFEVPLARARIRGRIDLLLHADRQASNKVELVDFKTSENRPPSQFHRNQLRLYATALERTGLEPVRLSIHDLDADTGGRFEVPFDEHERSAFEDRLRGWVHGIAEGEFEPVGDLEVCERCDFRRFCAHGPERRLSLAGRAESR